MYYVLQKYINIIMKKLQKLYVNRMTEGKYQSIAVGFHVLQNYTYADTQKEIFKGKAKKLQGWVCEVPFQTRSEKKKGSKECGKIQNGEGWKSKKRWRQRCRSQEQKYGRQ